MVVRPLDELSRFVDGQNAVREYELIAALPCRFFLAARLLPRRGPVGSEVAVVGGGQHIPGVGKRRHPGVVFSHGVPSDVVGMDVSIDHYVHGVAVDARRLQRSQEAGVQMVQGWHVRACAVIADAGVHDDGQPVDLDDPALDRDVPLIGVGVEEVRHQQVGVVPPPRRRRPGEKAGRQVELKFHNAGHIRAAKPDLAHRYVALARR
jgi:hypothetical protein